MVRRILHVDMDAFYASVEQRDRPELRGKPVAVGGRRESRGVVAAASYEARKFGVRSAIPMSRAVRLCPRSRRSSRRTSRSTARCRSRCSRSSASVTPLVEPLSLDEAYLDVTENAWGEPLGVNVAKRLKALIRETTGLTASAGVAPNKFLAKIASAWRKPDGLTVIAPERVESFLQQLPVDALWGVGPVTAKRLRERGIDAPRRRAHRRSGDAARRPSAAGPTGCVKLAHGDDDRAGRAEPAVEVVVERMHVRARSHRPRSRSARRSTAWRAKTPSGSQTQGLVARTVTIKVRYERLHDRSRAATRAAPTSDPDDDRRSAPSRCSSKTDAGARPVRLLGAGVHNLSKAEEHAILPFQ